MSEQPTHEAREAALSEGFEALSTYAGLVVDPSRRASFGPRLKHLLEDIETLEQMDKAGLEPPAVFDPRWR